MKRKTLHIIPECNAQYILFRVVFEHRMMVNEYEDPLALLTIYRIQYNV
jgi:hypothetical protein